MPPLLSAIPTKDEILKSNMEDLLCLKIIDLVKTETLSCISKMNKRGNTIFFPSNSTYIRHSERIVNSHRGFIDNFVQCLKSLYTYEINSHPDFAYKLQEIIDIIHCMRDEYDPDYVKPDGSDDENV